MLMETHSGDGLKRRCYLTDLDIQLDSHMTARTEERLLYD